MRIICNRIWICWLCIVSVLCNGCSGSPSVTVETFLTEMGTEGEENAAGSFTDRTEQKTDIGMYEPDPDMSNTELPVCDIAVHVCGAVVLPGVYTLAETSRVMDAVCLAGGFTDDADQEWLNLADHLQDGQQIRIPTRDETDSWKTSGETDAFSAALQQDHAVSDVGSTDRKIDLNRATREELMTLPGIGEAKAQAILDYRSEHGPFQSIDDIMNISGIKDAVFRKIRDRVTV